MMINILIADDKAEKQQEIKEVLKEAGQTLAGLV